ADAAADDEYIFLTPNFDTDTPASAAMIVDANGEVVWMDPSGQHDGDAGHFDLRPQEYQGEQILTYFKGPASGGWGYGDIYLMDESYQVFNTVTTGGSLPPHETDFHDMTITDDATMLLLAYVATQTDLTEVGGTEDGWVENAVIQEVDMESGDVVFEWSALDHIPVTDSMLDFEQELQAQEDDEDDDEAELGTQDQPFDYFHINSATLDDDGSILVSARHTHAVYQLDRDTGAVQWILGGKSSDFEMAEDAVFEWQHSAARDADGTITLLDNHTKEDDGDSSRGLRLEVDEDAMTASVATEYAPPQERPAGSMANTQPLENGNMIVGWGAQPYYSEFTKEGELLYDVCHGDACHEAKYDGGGGSYRAYKGQWEGDPNTSPDAVVEEHDNGQQRVYMSWNGATEVDRWRLVAGPDEDNVTQETSVQKTSFETSIPVLDEASQYVVVEALDANGDVLATATPES
ncbi:MAG TPA: arylsulfotransferase family protein, partial [Candidatus Yaniella excrementavium]|nr:arylsulfotransferase family protein [Candidatus Yaniella excrementavium]